VKKQHLQLAETHLRLLLTQQRKRVEEIKKATNYDSTRKLIERYDETGSQPIGMPPVPVTPQRGQPSTPTPASRGKAQAGTPRAPGHLVGAGGTPAPGRECSRGGL
jgi:hypothetical protein